jgi:uncharacterized repeat protein (TIGR01451 family)/fimbrial isopeptide formation D2 family protein
MHRVRMSRRSPLLGFGLAWACLLALLTLLAPVAARAEGKPNLGLSVTSPKSILFGAKATVTLEADNPAGEPYGYNLSYRAVLPEGVAYVAGSAKLGSGGAAPTPTILENQPKTKETTVIWSNVGDLSPASHSTLSFEITPSQVTYPVASEFTVPAEAFLAEAPRYLPKFKANGEPKGPESTSFTGSAKGSSKTTISALEIKQEEGSPEGEILRGVHDHQTVYKVTVTNNKVNATTNVNVDDWLPASLEYLGCGGAGSDHTTEAPTNPGSAEEYPGSGSIEVATLGGCTAPAFVETVETDPDGAGVDPIAVYTHLRWTVAELKPGESRTFEFRAAVPLRENTTTWTGAEPTPASGHQATNLDNNSGAETKDGESIVTFAKAEGLYKGTTAVSAEEHLTRVAKDLTTEKSADLKTLSDGQVSKWTILVHSSEYRYNTGVEVTDTLPNGLCPLSSANLSNPVSVECEPNGDLPSSSYTSTKEEENGSWKLVWNETTDPALATLKQNETTTITFYSKTRTHYQSKHSPAGPILSNDKIENAVLANATTNVVCGNDTDCSEEHAKPIYHERPLSEPVQDNSHFTQTAVGPTIDKEVAASGTNCLGDTYTSAIPVYHPGDQICWRLQASFPETLSTHGTQVTDFLPELVRFDEAFEEKGEKGQARGAGDTLPATTFDHSEAGGGEAGGALRWTLPESGIVGNGSQRFERVFATNATLTKGTPLGDLQGNLMKFASINSAGESFALRAEADFKLQFPQLSLEKQIVKVNGTAITPVTSKTVKGGSEAEFALTVKNAGEVEALNTEVRDLLPNGIACAEVVAGSISNKGSCTSGEITWGETGLGQEAIGVPALGQTVLHFSVKLSTALDPATTLEDKAGVREYHSATNIGGEYTYIPAENIDSMFTEKEENVPAANAHAALKTEEVTLTKTHTTSVNEAGNKLNEATIGEEVTFEVTATIPSGTTLSGFAKISDPGIPTERLTYEVGSVEALVNGSTAPGTFKAEEISGSPVITLPENYAAPTAESVKVTMRFRTHVANVLANNAAGSGAEKAISNKGKLAWTNPLSGAQTREASNEVPLVEPLVTLSEKNNTTEGKIHGGQLIEYALKVGDGGQSAAFGSEVLDKVPSGLTPTDKAGVPLANGGTTESGGIWNQAERTITWKVGKIEPGVSNEQSLAFFVKVNESPISSTSLENRSEATIASLATGGRTPGAPTPSAIKPNYEIEKNSKLEIEGPTIAKIGSPEKATIGAKVTYTLTVQIPAYTVSYNETVIDTLPSTLELVKYESAGCTSGCAAGPSEIDPKPYTAESNSGTHANRVAWYLGNVASASVTRELKLVYVTLVRSVPRGGGAEVKAPSILKNSASLYYNTADSLYTFNEAVVPAVTFGKTVGPVDALTEVIEPSVVVVKEASVDGGAFSTTTPFKVTDGDTITYRLQVTNSGAAPAYNVSVTDALPASGLTEVKTVANAPITSHEAEVTKETASELAWTIPTLGTPATPGKTITLEYTAKLAPVTTLHQGQEIANTAKVPTYFGVPAAERTGESYFNEKIEYRSYEGNEATLKAKVALPTITVEKTTGTAGFPASANAEVGQAFTWRVVVKNTSKVAAKNVKVSDKLPANWEYIAGSAEFSGGHKEVPTQSGSLEPGRELTWSTSIELAAETSTILTYQAKPTLAAESNPGSGAGHPNKNSASATVLDALGNPEDAEGPFAAGPATAQGVLQVPVLTVTKTPAKASVAAGAKDEYTIVIHNTGAGVAREVLAEDSLPAGMTYKAGSATASPTTGFSEKSASGSTIVWEVASIAAGASVEITVPVGTEASLASATKLKNTVAVHATAAPTPVEAEGTITLTTSADVSVEKQIAGKGVSAVPGHEITYEVSATNHGPSLAREVKLVDKLPAGLTYVSSTPECEHSASTITCTAGNLTVEQKASFQIKVLLAASLTGTLSNTVTAESLTPDPAPSNNKATKEVAVSPEADLSLEKTAPETVITGEELTWTLTANNNGPSDAKGVTVVDPLPAGAGYLKSTSTQGTCKEAAGTLTCKLEGLAAGASAKITITAKVTAAPGALTNTATVGGEEPDPEPANNKASATSTVTGPPTVLKASNGPEATIGHQVTYTLTVTVPAHAVVFDQTVIDTLPDTLDFDEYLSATCTSGCTKPETTIVPQTYTPKILGATPFTTSVAWYLGSVAPAPTARTIVLVYRASVRASHRAPPHQQIQAPAEIKNSATLYYDKAAKGSFEKETIPSPGSFEHETAPVSSTTKVVEPNLTLVKEASVDSSAFSSTTPFTVTDGDSVSYRLQVKNTGTAPVYDTTVTDTPPSGLVEVSTVTNPAATVTKAWSGADHEIAWQIAGPLQPNETVTLEYHAKLAAASTLKAGQTLTNAATISSYFGVPESERNEKLKNFTGEEILYREYKGPSAQLTATVALPAISIEKTTGAAGFPASANAEVDQPFAWRVVVKNTSTVAAKSLTVADTLPANWEYVAGSASFSAGDPSPAPPIESASKATGTQLEWQTAIELAPGESTTLTYQAKPTVAAESAPGTGAGHPNINQASATVEDAAGNAADADGPFAAGPVHAEAVLIVPGLAVTKTPALTTVNAGEADSYEIVVQNAPSAGIAREVMVVDTLPAGMTYKANAATANPAIGFSEEPIIGNHVTWKIAVINPAESVRITVPVGTEPSVETGSELINTVAAHSVEQPTPVEASGTIKITTSADVKAEKSVLDGASAVPGAQLTYVLSATDEGPSAAREVELVDKLPAGLTYVSSSPECAQSAGTVTCKAGDLELDQTTSFQIVVSIPSNFTGSIANTVLAESTETPGHPATPDPEPNNNSHSVEVMAQPSADLELVKTALSPEVLHGQQAVFSLLATNKGPSDAVEAKIVDMLPAGLEYVSATGATCAAVGQEVTCTLGAMAAGTSQTVMLTTQPAGLGSYTNSAVVSSTTPDPESHNNASEAAITVLPAADLSLEKTVTPTTVQLPGEVVYTLVVANHGPDPAQAVVLTDPLPAGETYISDDAGCTVVGQVVTCQLGELADQATHTIQLHVGVGVGVSLSEQTVTNTAEVTSATGDPVRSNNISKVSIQTHPAPAPPVTSTTTTTSSPKGGVDATIGASTSTRVTLRKLVLEHEVAPGGRLDYRLIVHNGGGHAAEKLRVCDSLPEQTTVLRRGGGHLGGARICFTLATLAPGHSHTFTIVLRADSDAHGRIVNHATVTGSDFDPAHAHASTPVSAAGTVPRRESRVTG